MNKLEELRLHVSALRTVVDQNEGFFGSIVYYVRRLEAILTRPTADLSQRELALLALKIEQFYDKQPAGYTVAGITMWSPHATFATRATFWEVSNLVAEICDLSEGEFAAQIAALVSTAVPETESQAPCIFIGHGRSKLWARLKVFLQDELGLDTVTYESEPRTGESIVSILESMLDQASFAVLVLTAEDETTSASRRARQNVVHEAGLFQGRLGFRKAILLIQQGLEEFSNVAGLQHIRFSEEAIEQTFYELQRVLKREGQIP